MSRRGDDRRDHSETTGLLRLTRGMLHPSPAPGLGVTDDIEDRLEEAMGEAPLGGAGP